MNISKISTTISNTLNASSKAVQKPNCLIQDGANSTKLTNTLECLATNAIPSINKNSKKVNLPEFIYHITSRENYEKILRDGKMKVSKWELDSGNGCNGIYFIDKDNFLNNWLGRKEPEILGDSPMDVGELLIAWTCKDTKESVAIKIPTSKLDISQLRFRPYIEACKESLETYNPNTGKIESRLVKEGLPIEDLSKYANSKEPIEYVYFGEITPEIFCGSSSTLFCENLKEMATRLFG